MLSCISIITYLFYFLVEYVSSQQCEFRLGGVSYLSGSLQVLGETIASGYKLAMYDYSQSTLHDMAHFTSHIASLDTNESCILSLDLRDIKTDIKVGIVEIFDLSSTYDQCAIDTNNNNSTDGDSQYSDHECSINIPFVVGPAASGDSLTTNPLIEAFNLIQFSPSATSTFLSNYDSFYRPIPSDDIQAKALIDLCDYFGWDTLGLLYINTDYGTSLQRALTSYANSANIKTTTFSYISSDNVTLTDAVEAMYDSNIFIFVLIVYDGDVNLLSELLTKYSMYEYPFYYIGTDAWLYNSQFTWNEFLPIYGGMIGTCPWSPSINDSLSELYPYPLNISLKMYSIFYNEWIALQEAERYDITYNVSEPGLFTIYAYDVMLTIIKIIDQYLNKYEISTIDEFWSSIYSEEAKTISDFKEILNEIWFIGLSGNVSYGEGGGDRSGGLFSFCNVHPETGNIVQIGFNLDDKVIINEENIVWPIHSYSAKNKPQTAYISYNGISSKSGNVLPIFLWFFIFLSMLLTIIYVSMLYYYRKRKIIMASQWKLSLFMAFGCIICYLSLILFGIDESFPNENKLDYNWSALCNVRMLLLNLSFSLIFGPLFTKIWRIKKIFNTAMIQLKKCQIPDYKLLIYNISVVSIDTILCIILIATIPYDREYRSGEIINYATTQWGSCTTEYGYIYFIILGLPKLIFSLYCMTLSISVYSTVSMMKFNEGLQVLICMVISVLLIFITLGIASIITIDSATSSIFFYSFISFILLMICNFCCAVMILPRLFSIWKGYEDEEYINKNNETNAVKKYMKTLRTNLNKLSMHKLSMNTTGSSDPDTNNKGTDYHLSPASPHSPNNSGIIEFTDVSTNIPSKDDGEKGSGDIVVDDIQHKILKETSN